MIQGKKAFYNKKYYYVFARHIYRYDGLIVDLVLRNAPFRNNAELEFLAQLMAKTRYKTLDNETINDIKALLQDYERWEAKADISLLVFKESLKDKGLEYKDLRYIKDKGLQCHKKQ